MVRLLYLTNAIPYKSICHAGGKTFYYYVNAANANDGIDLKVIGLCKADERQFIKEIREKIDCRFVLTMGTSLLNIKRILMDIWGICTFQRCFEQSYFKKYYILKEVKQLHEEGFEPDVIILEWTNMVLLVKSIKKVFPYAKIIASEHDVSFLGAQRKYIQADGKVRHRLKKRYLKLKKLELDAISACDIVMPQNEKDKKLLMENNVPEEKIHVLTAYFHNMSHIKREQVNHDILFWGAMYRQENYEAAIWFIDNVMSLLEDTDVRFIVAGNRPPKELQIRSNDRVIVTGFIEDETPYFANSLCFVSPLLTGAGIKVKVIEALSAGIPILTNSIGIEGIPAEDGVSYFHCETAQDYAYFIKKFLNGEIEKDSLLENQYQVIEKYFDLEKSAKDYISLIKHLGEKNATKK